MRITRIAAIVAIALTLGGCHMHRKAARVVVDPEFLRLTKDQLFERGEQLYARKRFPRARTYYSYVYETYPNDPLGRRSLLRVADTFFGQGDQVNLVEAQYKYRDFINRYPGSDRGDYALLQIANVAYRQMEKPDRDQQKTREAVEKYNDMLKTYPHSALRPEAEKKLHDAVDRLARHDHIVARFYMKRKSWESAVRRLNGLVEQYADYGERDGVFYDLGTSLRSLGRKGEARLYFERVISEFPGSNYSAKAKKQLDLIKA